MLFPCTNGSLTLVPILPICGSITAPLRLKQIRPTEALNHFKAAARRQPEEPGIHLGMANSHQLLGDIASAEACLEKELMVSPDSAQAAVNLGWILEEQNRVPEALMQYRKALYYNPNHPDLRWNHGPRLPDAGRLRPRAGATTSSGGKHATNKNPPSTQTRMERRTAQRPLPAPIHRTRLWRHHHVSAFRPANGPGQQPHLPAVPAPTQALSSAPNPSLNTWWPMEKNCPAMTCKPADEPAAFCSSLRAKTIFIPKPISRQTNSPSRPFRQAKPGHKKVSRHLDQRAAQ